LFHAKVFIKEGESWILAINIDLDFPKPKKG